MKKRILAAALLFLVLLYPRQGVVHAAEERKGLWVITAPELLRQTRSLAVFGGIVESQGKVGEAENREMITEALQEITLLATEATLTRYKGFQAKTQQQAKIQYGTASLPVRAPVGYWGQFQKENPTDCPAALAQKVQKKLKVDAFVVFYVVFWSAPIGDLVEYNSGTRDDLDALFRKGWNPPGNENVLAIACQVFDSKTGRQIAYAKQASVYGNDMLVLSQMAWRTAASLAAELVSLKMENIE